MPPVNVNANTSSTVLKSPAERKPAHMYAWVAARVALAGVFLWAFFDKLFGLNYATKPASSWLSGGSPTKGFLGHAGGYLQNFYHGIAGNPVTDALFMAALLGVGLALLLGIGLRIAAVSGTLLMLSMWSVATLGIKGISNPVIDDHIVYACILIGLALVNAGSVLGLGQLEIVKKHAWLQ